MRFCGYQLSDSWFVFHMNFYVFLLCKCYGNAVLFDVLPSDSILFPINNEIKEYLHGLNTAGNGLDSYFIALERVLYVVLIFGLHFTNTQK